ncbi:Cytosolic copper metallochaperone [Puccinia graminis f. sp. tritici]|uniref:Cytosolic copper metallochaperone n=1 Tax=Puccinia graminis f. sp. tritici TaxID=56615 RepID=A0A5B0LYA0_PUCGR|nr:Cytosolic copper metallochaperone [Puccinia graminis f. sp. tritici]
MTCSGCSGAVERALKKQEGVSKIDISLETQTVLVHAHPPATFDIVREKIAKTGKTINSNRWDLLNASPDPQHHSNDPSSLSLNPISPISPACSRSPSIYLSLFSSKL